ncbi:MAG: extracellular solute-binding protein [Spirochaetales bacterium]|nr:extracellular solute-binding protein [Spirochaetales bacterium]
MFLNVYCLVIFLFVTLSYAGAQEIGYEEYRKGNAGLNLIPEPVEIAGDRTADLILRESADRSWTFKITQKGVYNIELLYLPLEGKGTEIEVGLQIDGEVPFREAEILTLYRNWVDSGSIRRDNRGNDIRPSQRENPVWTRERFRDREGYFGEAFAIRLDEGVHSLTLKGRRESFVIGQLRLVPAQRLISYEEYRKESKSGNGSGTVYFFKVQGELASSKSDPSLYPQYDHSSPATEPFHVSKVRLNTIGGSSWRMPGQWIEWEITVPEDGFYKLGGRVRQNLLRGILSHRRILIDGEVPFQEMDSVGFNFEAGWVGYVFGGEDPYLFFLEKGEHLIRMEVVLGELSDYLRTVEKSVLELNSLYRKIIMITGTVPDPYRTYNLEYEIPEMLTIFQRQADIMNNLSEELKARTDENGAQVAILAKLAHQLEDFSRRPETVHRRLSDFKINIGALSAWMLEVREQPLEIDYLAVMSPDREMPSSEAGLFRRIKASVQSFIASFFEEYDVIGNVDDPDKALNIWLVGGRERATIMKTLIDDHFSRQYDIPVNLKLVSESILIPSTLAGLDVDVAMNVKRATPVNFAMRNAVEDLSSYPGFDEVLKQFHGSAVVPFEYNGGTFALPEEQIFSVMFARTDILYELGLRVPETWEDVYEIIPELQKNNLQFGFPIPEAVEGAAGVASPSQTFSMLLYQNGGDYYSENGERSILDEEVGIRSFLEWTDLYTSYRVPYEYNFQNRFRTGEMPLVITYYRYFNQLSVFAPEIKGLWDFGPVPGKRDADGRINREVGSDVTGCIVMKNSARKDQAWEFLKWWTSTETQIRFGREMESLLGAAGREPTANLEAISSLAWPTDVYEKLKSQWNDVRGVPEVPGGYYTGRHLENAFRQVVFEGDSPRETLEEYVGKINGEMISKRREFGL